MAKRLAEGNRVRTVLIVGSEGVATGAPEEIVMGAHVFQDDVTVIGVSMLQYGTLLDAQLNADAALIASCEVTRQASRGQPGTVLTLRHVGGWTAAIVCGVFGGEAQVMFPTGQGIEIDEGESLNLLSHADWIGTGTLTLYAQAILYYVER